MICLQLNLDEPVALAMVEGLILPRIVRDLYQ